MKSLVKRLSLLFACVFGLAFAAPALAGTNLVGNPGFESGTTGWNTSGSTAPGINLAQSSTQAHSGAFSGLLTDTAVGSCGLNDSPDWVGTTGAGTYTGSIWVRGGTLNTPLNLRFREYASSGGAYLGGATSTVSLDPNTWQQVTVTYTPVSPGASTLDFNAYIPAADGVVGTCFYADDAMIVLTPPAGSGGTTPTPTPTPTPAVVSYSTPMVMGCLANPHARGDGSMGLFFQTTAADWNAGVTDSGSFLFGATPAIYVQGYGTMCQLSDLVTYGGDPTKYVDSGYQVNESGLQTPAGISPVAWGAAYEYYVQK